MVATGNASIDTILGDVVKAGTQELILTGEVTPATLVQAGLVSSIKEGVNYIQEALSPEQLQEVVVTATKKGQDLGNGNYLLDTGAVINDQGIVGYDAGNGFVDTGSGYLNLTSGNSYDYEIDTDGDGQITSNDLQEVVANPNVYGDVSFDLPSSGGIAFDYTNPDYLSQMDKWSDSQVVDQLQQAGFDVRVDSETGELYLEGNITSDNEAVLNYITQRNAQNFQEVNFVDYGNGVVADKSQKYTLGTDGNGNHYIIDSDETGGTRIKFIGKDDFEALGGLVSEGATEGAIEGYLSDKGILTGGNVFTGVNPFTGEATLEDPSGIQDWLTLEAGSNASSAVQVDFTKVDKTTEEVIKEQVTKQDVSDTGGGGATASTASTSAAAAITSSTSSASAAEAATAAVSSNAMTASEVAELVSAAVASGAMSAETAQAASSAANAASEGASGRAGLGETADSGITAVDSDGTVSLDLGGGGTTAQYNQAITGLLTGVQGLAGTGATGINTGAGVSGAGTGQQYGVSGTATDISDSVIKTASGTTTGTGDAGASTSTYGVSGTATDISDVVTKTIVGSGDAGITNGTGAAGAAGAAGAGGDTGLAGAAGAGGDTGLAGAAGAGGDTGLASADDLNGDKGTGTGDKSEAAGAGTIGGGTGGTGIEGDGGTGDGTKGTGKEGDGDNGVGDDGTGEGPGGDGFGFGGNGGMFGLSLQQPQLPSAPEGYSMTIPYAKPEIPTISMPQKDYNKELNDMLARLSQGLFTGNIG
jgi:hypothetical protein